MRRQPTFFYLSAKVLSTIIEDNILHLPFKTLSPFLRGGQPSYAKISLCRKRFCGRLTTQGMRRSNQAGGGGGGPQPYLHFSVKKTLCIGLSTGIETVTSFHSPV